MLTLIWLPDYLRSAGALWWEPETARGALLAEADQAPDTNPPSSVLQVTSYSPACAHSYLVPTLGSYALLVLADTQLKSLKINPVAYCRGILCPIKHNNNNLEYP